MKTQAMEDYLKAIHDLGEAGGRVSTTALSERLDVTPASATGMIKKLAEMKLVAHAPYQGVRLTAAGRRIALEVIRHHRLLELYLAEALKVPWDRVHVEAEKLEHVLSEELEERIDELLGFPTSDPHGSPIPRRDGTVEPSPVLRLADIAPGASAIVAEVPDEDDALLRYLGGMGLYPRTEVRVLAAAPFEGPLTIRVLGLEHSLSREVAGVIRVADVAAGSAA
jgi:DtxR family transcriptional regulator, Mn-dependent transcriptional regulator